MWLACRTLPPPLTSALPLSCLLKLRRQLYKHIGETGWLAVTGGELVGSVSHCRAWLCKLCTAAATWWPAGAMVLPSQHVWPHQPSNFQVQGYTLHCSRGPGRQQALGQHTDLLHMGTVGHRHAAPPCCTLPKPRSQSQYSNGQPGKPSQPRPAPPRPVLAHRM